MAQISGTITRAGQSLNGTVRASGRGIASVDIDSDGYLVITYTDGEVWTSDEVIIGNGIESIDLTSTSGAVKTYTITFTDGTTTTFNVTDGEVTNASLALITGDLTDLETTDKTDIVSAINEVNGKAEDADEKADTVDEHVGDLSELETEDKTSAVDAINEVLSKIPVMTKEVTGNPIVIDDALGEVQSLNVELEPVQDLHGYDKPWAGGAGKNKLENIATSQTVNGITFTVNDDGSVTANGTSTSEAVFVLNASTLSIGAGTYTASGASGGSNTTYYLQFKVDGQWRNAIASNTFTASTSINVALIDIKSGVTLNNYTFYPQIETGSTATTFEPYSNICPITGHDSVTVTDTGKNMLDAHNWQDTSGGITVNGDNSITIVSKSYQEDANSCAMPVLGQQTYFSFDVKVDATDYPSQAACRLFYKKADGTIARPQLISINLGAVGSSQHVGIAIPTDAVALVFGGWAYSGTITLTNMQLELGSAESTYESYYGHSTTVTLPHTVYGGDVDVTGGAGQDTLKLIDASTLGWNYDASGKRWQVLVIDIYNYSTRSATIWSDRYATDTTATAGDEGKMFTRDKGVYVYSMDNTTPPTGQLCYPLATPTDLTTTPTDITLYNGDNVVSSEGDMDMVYVRDIIKVIEKLEG